MRKKNICILKTTPLPWFVVQWLLVIAPPEIERREVLLSREDLIISQDLPQYIGRLRSRKLYSQLVEIKFLSNTSCSWATSWACWIIGTSFLCPTLKLQFVELC